MTGRFEGRTALVTGGGRGIGAATATRFAADGAKVVISDLDLEPAEAVAAQIRSQGGTALAVASDVTDRRSVEALVDRATKEYGGLDILVTCAGILRDNLIHKMTDNDWDLVVDTHLKGTFLCAQAAQRVMVPARRGKMVFLSSNSALGNRGQANYSAAKAGLQGMARTLAIELGGVHRDPHDAGGRRTHGNRLRGFEEGGRRTDPSKTDRPARGHRRRHQLPLQR